MRKKNELFTVVGRQRCGLKDDSSPNSKILQKKIACLPEPHINTKDCVVSGGYFPPFPFIPVKSIVS